MRDEFLVFGSPKIEQDEIDEVVDCLKSGWLGTGPKVARFEADFCEYKSGWGHPVAVNSCTAALHLAMLTLVLKPGDEVITTPLTFCATVNAIIHAGGQPVLADIDPETLNISPEQIERRITDRTKAIIPVHFAGRPCEMDALVDIAQRHNLVLIEDCAHSIESTYNGQHCGTFGKYGCFSFYVTKNLSTGEGGMILARDEQDAQLLKTLALHGMSKDAWKRFGDEGYKHYFVVEAGFKYNMMDIQAALGIHQLKHLEKNWVRRQQIWHKYDEAFKDLPIGLPLQPAENTRHAFHLYTILIDEAQAGISRDGFLDAIIKYKIGVGVHYLSIPEHPHYKERFGWSPDDFPVGRDVGRQIVSLPLTAKLTDKDAEDVIEAVTSIVCVHSTARSIR